MNMRSSHQILSITLATVFVLVVIASGQITGAAKPGPLITRAYPIDKQLVKTLATELKKSFADDPNVRFAADTRTGQLLVVAPREVHEELKSILAENNSSPLPVAVSQPRTAQPLAQPTNRERQVAVSLRHASPKTIQTTLQRLYGGRAPTTRSPDGQRVSITLVSRGGQQVRLTTQTGLREVILAGPESAVAAWQRLIRTLDSPAGTGGQHTQLVPLRGQQSPSLQRAMQLIDQRTHDPAALAVVAGSKSRTEIIRWDSDPSKKPTAASDNGVRLAQAPKTPPANAPPANAPPANAPPANTPPASTAPATPTQPGTSTTIAGEQEGLQGPVQIEYLEGLDVMVLRGNKSDVDRVIAIINEIEQLSTVTEPSIKILDLQHVDSKAMAELVGPLYDDILSLRQGRVSITPLVKPNALLLIGRPESVTLVSDLVKKLDQPVAPDKQFHVFHLAHMSATDAQTTLEAFYEERGGLGTRVLAVSDYRSNSLIVQASPRDAAEIRKLLAGVDIATSASVNEVRVFRLKNTLAEDLAPVIEQALRGDDAATTTGNRQPTRNNTNQQTTPRSMTLSLTTVDAEGKRQYRSGVLTDVRITADLNANALVVRGPEDSMPLIEALIKQLDELPSEDAEIKVFTIVNGDASLLADVLEQLFGNQVTSGGRLGNQSNQGQTLAENPLIPLRFSVDGRTNSIVATGSMADLRVVEAILLRLDEEDVQDRQNAVFRLSYAPAADIAAAINQFLADYRQIPLLAPESISPFEQVEREVVVVAEPVSNSLIVSATPQYYAEISRIIQELDARPPMVMIQVLIAEVNLDNFYEWGVELGLQDPLLFDRSVVEDNALVPGFNFNNRALGNSNSAESVATRSNVGSQALGSFALGRTNSTLGFGGLVLSASSDALSLLVRALEVDGHLQVLSRPQIMTLDNQPAFVQVGQRVPYVTSSQVTSAGTTINNTTFENVGLLLGVTPRISPDGLVVMEIDAERSALDDSDGVPISVSITGEVIFAPIINIQTAQTTVIARSGQTVVLGGLITEEERTINRGVPYISSIPLLRELFTYEQIAKERTELMIIMTPYIVRNENDVNCINEMETARMSWCLSDVYRVHGYFDLNACQGGKPGDESCEPYTIYPDDTPSGSIAPQWEEVDSNPIDVPHSLPTPQYPMSGAGSIEPDNVSTLMTNPE